MYIYFFSFGVSSFCFWYAEKKKGTLFYKLFVFVGLIIPISLAGLRDISIGTDTKYYLRLFEVAKLTEKYVDFLNCRVIMENRLVPVKEWEMGYTLLVYGVSRLSGSYQLLMIITHTIIILCVYFGMKHFEQEASIWMGMLSFFFLFFNISLNATRQWLAMAVLFYGFIYVVEDKKCKTLITLLIATSFHSSAFLFIAICLLYWYSQINNDRKILVTINRKEIEQSTYKIFFVIILGVVLLGGIQVISSILTNINA